MSHPCPGSVIEAIIAAAMKEAPDPRPPFEIPANKIAAAAVMRNSKLSKLIVFCHAVIFFSKKVFLIRNYIRP